MKIRQTIYKIDISPKTVRTEQKAYNKLLWFDQDSGKTIEFYGGQLIFVFDIEKKKLVPKVEDLYYIAYKSESIEQEVRNWIKNYGSRYGAEIDIRDTNNREIVVNVDSINDSVFEYALERKGFRYEKS